MNDFQKLEIDRLSKEMAEKLAALPGVLRAAQEHEHEQAEIENRAPRRVNVEAIVEIPVDVLEVVLAKISDPGPADETIKAYRLSVKRNKAFGAKAVFVRAEQLSQVFDAAGIGKPEAKVEEPREVV